MLAIAGKIDQIERRLENLIEAAERQSGKRFDDDGYKIFTQENEIYEYHRLAVKWEELKEDEFYSYGAW